MTKKVLMDYRRLYSNEISENLIDKEKIIKSVINLNKYLNKVV
jgi:hypothetical protein